MYKFDEGDADTMSDTCLAVMCVVRAGLMKVTQTLHLIPASCDVCCAYKFGGNDTDTTSNIYLAMMCIVVCAGLVEMTQTHHLIPVLL